MLIPKTSESVMLNLFQHLDPKIRCALKSKNPLNAAKSRPSSKSMDPSFEKNGSSTLRVQVLGSSGPDPETNLG
jgi:hypothetical protein